MRVIGKFFGHCSFRDDTDSKDERISVPSNAMEMQSSEPCEAESDPVSTGVLVKVQERVLQKAHHVLEMPGGPLFLTLRGSLEPPPTTTSPVRSCIVCSNLQAFQTAQNALHLRGFVLGTRPEQDIRIVLLGKTGGGKSSAGNTIFGQDDVFLSDSSSISATQKCKAHTKNIKGRNITLIDTPGFFDTDIPEEELKPKIVKCITECAPGPHAFLIVLKVERYTVHENEAVAVAKIETYFSPEAFKYATVLFTHGDQLNGLTVEKFVQQNAELNKLVEKCGGRYHVIDNKYWNTNQQGRYSNQYQVAELLNTIEKMVRDNGGGFYTNEMLQEAERLIQAEMEGLRKELKGKMTQEEMRKQV
nr:GTPase IMAP family member 7-like [Oncorhynchus nerka]